MARKTVRVELPRKNTDDLLKLMDKIIQRDTDLDADSPLDDAIIIALKAKRDEVKPIRKAGTDAEALAQQKNQEARQKLGIDKGQTIEIPGTGIYMVKDIQEKLLNKFKGNEEQLTTFGFDVVVGSFAPKGGKPKPPTT